MGILLIKKDVMEDWMQATRKNYLWIAREYGRSSPKGCISPSYISQIVNNNTNIAGNFLGFILHQTKLNYDDLFHFDPNISKRTFHGKEVYFNGAMLKSTDYSEVVKAILEKRKVLDIRAR